MRLYRTHEEARTTYPRFFIDRSKVVRVITWDRFVDRVLQILSLLLNGRPEQEQRRALTSSLRSGSGVSHACFGVWIASVEFILLDGWGALIAFRLD